MDRRTKIMLEISYRKGLKTGARRGRFVGKIFSAIGYFLWYALAWRSFYRVAGWLWGFFTGRAWAR
jgi:hypothetical protein